MKRLSWVSVSTGILLAFSVILNAADHTIYSRNCAGKTSNWYDRTTGDNKSCGCPCGSAEWMGIKGEYYTALEGEIWYKFTATTGNYTVSFVYQGDSDGKAPYKIFVAGKQIGSGTVGSSSGSAKFGPVCIKNGDEIRLWARSDYSTGATGGKHGNYCRWNRFDFTRTGECGSTTEPEPTGTPDKVTGLAASNITGTSLVLTWNKSANATGYEVYWTNTTTPDAKTDKLTYSVSGLKPATKYSVWVKAYNSTAKASGTNIEVTTQASTASDISSSAIAPGGPALHRTLTGVSIRGARPGMELVLYSLTGMVLRKISLNSNQTEVGFDNLGAGCALISLHDISGRMWTMRTAGVKLR